MPLSFGTLVEDCLWMKELLPMFQPNTWLLPVKPSLLHDFLGWDLGPMQLPDSWMYGLHMQSFSGISHWGPCDAAIGRLVCIAQCCRNLISNPLSCSLCWRVCGDTSTETPLMARVLSTPQPADHPGSVKTSAAARRDNILNAGTSGTTLKAWPNHKIFRRCPCSVASILSLIQRHLPVWQSLSLLLRIFYCVCVCPMPQELVTHLRPTSEAVPEAGWHCLCCRTRQWCGSCSAVAWIKSLASYHYLPRPAPPPPPPPPTHYPNPPVPSRPRCWSWCFSAPSFSCHSDFEWRLCVTFSSPVHVDLPRGSGSSLSAPSSGSCRGQPAWTMARLLLLEPRYCVPPQHMFQLKVSPQTPKLGAWLHFPVAAQLNVEPVGLSHAAQGRIMLILC